MWQPGKVVGASAVAAAVGLVVVMAHPLNHVASQQQVQVSLANELSAPLRWLNGSIGARARGEGQVCWYDTDIPRCE